MGASGALFYVLKRRRKTDNSSDYESLTALDTKPVPFELSPTLKRHKEIGGEYFWMSKIDRSEAEDIYNSTGYLIVVPENRMAFRHEVGKGHFGKIKIGKRLKDGEYVAVKKVKEEHMDASREEASMQKDAAGENVLPIYNTVVFENVMYHFMPLAGLGSGMNIQKQLSSVKGKLAQEILKYVANDVLRGLANIHDKGIYHLDLKADNIVFMNDGTAFITDFGCAKKTKRSPGTIGDKFYFSPDRLVASLFDETFDSEKADLWATGMMLLTMYKNKSVKDLFNFPSDSEIANWNKEDFLKIFQEGLNNIDELVEPNEGSIWWVIKNLLDPNEDTRFTANQALNAACFKGLLKDMKAELFQKIRSEHLIEGTGSKKEIGMADYDFVNMLQLLKDENKKDEMQDLLDNYDPVSEKVTPEDVRTRRNEDYQFSPDRNSITPEQVRAGQTDDYEFSV